MQIQAPIPANPGATVQPKRELARIPAEPQSSVRQETPVANTAGTSPSGQLPPEQAQPVVLKPEPRALPNRPHPTDVLAKQMPEPDPSAQASAANPVGRHPHKTSVFARFAIFFLFLIAVAALVYGVITVLNTQPDRNARATRTASESSATSAANPAASATSSDTAKSAPGSFSKLEPILPAHATKPAQKNPSDLEPILPTPSAKQPVLIQPVPDLPSGMDAKSPGMDALAVLEKFLAAKSLAERLPIIETKTPESELATSCLAAPLPPAPKRLLEFQESNAIEEVVDFYFSVDFEMSDKVTNLQTVLVRTRGRGEPKVVVDPFLDLFGGRLAAYASKPSDKAGVFQVIVSPLASCNDPLVPDHEKKMTLKLLARDNTKEIAHAYFGKMSKIHEMLVDGTYNLSYGSAKSCTVMLAWNTKDKPDHPYLEAVALKALDWNP